jgi:hypothetical protein
LSRMSARIFLFTTIAAMKLRICGCSPANGITLRPYQFRRVVGEVYGAAT